MSYVISNYMIRENCRRHMIFLFEFLESWMSQQSNRNIWHHDWPCPFGSWTDFGILSHPARIQALYFLCRTYLHSRTHNCPANPLSRRVCYFLLHSSVSHCFTTGTSSFSAVCCTWFHKPKRQGTFFLWGSSLEEL